MKNIFVFLSFLVFVACDQKSTSTSNQEALVADTLAQNSGTPDANSSGESIWDRRIEEFIQGKELKDAQLPQIISVDSTGAGVTKLIYYFEDDILTDVYTERIEKGAYAYQYFINISPEDRSYLQFGNQIEDAIGLVGNTSSEWRRLTVDGENKLHVAEECDSYKWDYEEDFATDLKFIRDNKNKFVKHKGNEGERFLDLGDPKRTDKKKYWKVSEILFVSNLLSPTNFDPQLIKGFLSWWYPVYPDASDVFYRHSGCPDDIEYININVENGHYRWVEELFSGKSVPYTITAFEQGEGESFAITLEKDGIKKQRTMLFSEENSPFLFVDGNPHTSDEKKFDSVTMKCD